MRKQFDINGGLILAMLGSGLLLVPIIGLAPMIGIAAACGTSLYIANQLNNRH